MVAVKSFAAGGALWFAVLDAGWRGEMPCTVWIGRDGVREARCGLLTADVLGGRSRRVRR